MPILFFVWGGTLTSKILLFGGALFREGRLLESERLLDRLRYCGVAMPRMTA